MWKHPLDPNAIVFLLEFKFLHALRIEMSYFLIFQNLCKTLDLVVFIICLFHWFLDLFKFCEEFVEAFITTSKWCPFEFLFIMLLLHPIPLLTISVFINFLICFAQVLLIALINFTITWNLSESYLSLYISLVDIEMKQVLVDRLWWRFILTIFINGLLKLLGNGRNGLL